MTQIPIASKYHFQHITDILLKFYAQEKLLAILTNRLDPKLINDIITSDEIMGKIQNIYPTYFKPSKVRFTQNEIDDVTLKSQQNEIITLEHKRAHRDAKENKIQILKNNFFPQAIKKIQTIVQACQTCKE